MAKKSGPPKAPAKYKANAPKLLGSSTPSGGRDALGKGKRLSSGPEGKFGKKIAGGRAHRDSKGRFK